MSQETDVRAKNAERLALALKDEVAALRQELASVVRGLQEFADYLDEKEKIGRERTSKRN